MIQTPSAPTARPRGTPSGALSARKLIAPPTTGETGALWKTFLRSLVARGLSGVVLVISDAHPGLREAIRSTLLGATWQRCRVHLLRDVLAHVPKNAQGLIAAFARTIFLQPDGPSAERQLGEVAEHLRTRFPKAAEVLLGLTRPAPGRRPRSDPR